MLTLSARLLPATCYLVRNVKGETKMGPESITKTFGPPGTGKTERLLKDLEAEVKNGVPPELIAFVAFGADAVRDAHWRALRTINRLTRGADDLPFFRTFHSLAWRLLAIQNFKRVEITRAHREVFATQFGLTYNPDYDSGPTGSTSDEYLSTRMPSANFVMNLDAWLTNNMVRLSDWRSAPISYDGPIDDVEHHVELWRRTKAKWGRMEYADVLERCRVEHPLFLPTVLFVDEFQDVNKLQYALYEQWANEVERVYIAGDDDQCIFTFQGSSYDLFLRTHATNTRILGETHRNPAEVLAYAQRIIRRVGDRQEKTVCACDEPTCRDRRATSAQRVVVLERPNIDSILKQADASSTLILARTRSQVRSLRGLLLKNGVPFHDMRGPDSPKAVWTRVLIAAKEFRALLVDPAATITFEVARTFLGALRDTYHSKPKLEAFKALPTKLATTWPWSPLGEDMRAWSLDMLRPYFGRVPMLDELVGAVDVAPDSRHALESHLRMAPDYPTNENAKQAIRVGTIHSSKGLQANTVILVSDLSRRAERRIDTNQADHDAEHRLYYVGATRALKRLVVLRPFASSSFFPIPREVSA